MATLNELIWVGVDFDGTLAHKMPDFSIGEPIEENIAKLQKVQERGYKIVIHTARHWEDYIKIEEWLNKHNVPFKAIVCGKLLCHRYIDDRAINADEPDWCALL
jgi:hydroxymethylpyrimidine pyrophosphatase-like HAD family hydrolase